MVVTWARCRHGTTSLRWCTYFGNYDSQHILSAVTVDEYGQVYIAGHTASTNMPIMASSNYFYNQPTIVPNDGLDNDGFIAMFKPVDDIMEWCTYFGGNAGQLVERIHTLAAKEGALFAAGVTSKFSNLASYFPLQYNGIPGSFYDDIFGDVGSPTYDVFLTKFCTPWSDLAAGDEKLLPANDNSESDSFDVWWAHGNLNIQGVTEGGLVQCFAADGRMVLSQRLQPGHVSGIQLLDVGGLVSGVYIVATPSGYRSKVFLP